MLAIIYSSHPAGEVTERPKVQHWKCCVLQKGTVGSNPTLSAMLRKAGLRRVFLSIDGEGATCGIPFLRLIKRFPSG